MPEARREERRVKSGAPDRGVLLTAAERGTALYTRTGMPAVFAANEATTSLRATLRALSPEGLSAMRWLPGVLAPDWTLEDLHAAVEAGGGVLIADGDGVPIGVAVVRLCEPAPKAASVPFIAIAPERRFRGLGGEAGLALERWLRERHSVETVFAPVPDGRGLAVYFWLRLGYRPLLQADSPGPLIGLRGEPIAGIWMARSE